MLCFLGVGSESRALENPLSALPEIVLEQVDPPPRILVGDELQFTFDGTWTGDQYQFVAPSGPEGLSKSGWMLGEVARNENGGFAVSFVPVKGGELALPELIFAVDGRPVARTRSIQFQVLSAFSGDQQGKVPSEGFGAATIQFPLWAQIALGIVTILLIVGTFFTVRKFWPRSKSKATAVSAVILTEDERALKTLATLEHADFISSKRFKKLYFGVSETLKIYFGKRYRFDAQESTTDEMLRGLQRSGMGDLHIQRVNQLFQVLDRVKFTDFQPDHVEALDIIPQARSLVKETRLLKRVSTESGGNHAV